MHRQRFAPAILTIAFLIPVCPRGQGAENVLRSPETDAALEYRPSPAEEALLEEIQRGCFNYLWQDVGSPARLVKDRADANVSSVAAVGFQLAALPIGVKRGWIQRREGEQRALVILRALIDRDDNKKFGVYLHFVDHNTGGLKPDAPQVQASTVDHALLLAGAIPAATFFGGEVRRLVDRLSAETNWAAYLDRDSGYLSFGWRPEQPQAMHGAGDFRPWVWQWASDEERLIYFLASGSRSADHRLDPALYYKLMRRFPDNGPPFVMSWNGSLFTYFFSHCFIDYGRFAADRPAAFGIDLSQVDWVENSRRAVLDHRSRCLAKADEFETFRRGLWGLSPCTGFRDDGSPTYFVPSVPPNIWNNKEDYCGGTVAPYAAGSAIIFAPEQCLETLAAMRHLKQGDKWIAWQPVENGGYGLADSINLDHGRVSFDMVGIDVGPMLLAIENYRSSLIWNLFHKHPIARRAVKQLQFQLRAPR